MLRVALLFAVASCALLLPDSVVAQNLLSPSDKAAPTAATASLSLKPVILHVGSDRAVPLSEADLAGNRGGQTLVVGSQTLTSVTKGNVLNGNYVAGSVTLSDKALSNFNGVGNIVINTGAQVSLQSGMNLTINVAP